MDEGGGPRTRGHSERICDERTARECRPRNQRKISSRNKEQFLVGKAAKMPSSQLPTRMDVLKHYLYLKEKRGPASELKRIISCPFGPGFRYISYDTFSTDSFSI